MSRVLVISRDWRERLHRRGRFLRIRNASKEIVLADNVAVADTSAERRRGLLQHQSLPKGQGIWIVPCEAVHTWGMQFPIDVLFLNRRRQVVKVRKHMSRRQVAICLRAHSVLELPAGTAEVTCTAKGDQLEFER